MRFGLTVAQEVETIQQAKTVLDFSDDDSPNLARAR